MSINDMRATVDLRRPDLLMFPDGGIPDLAIAPGKKIFDAAKFYPAGRAPSFLVTADLNLDSKLDLVVVNSDPQGGMSGISVLLGVGDGTFANPADHATTKDASAVAVADFNLDGKLDVAVSNTEFGGTGSISLFPGIGGGGLGSPIQLLAGANPIGIAASDLNADAKIDLVVGNVNGGVTVLLGKGDLTFQAPSRVTGPVRPTALIASDLNNDGKIDLTIADAVMQNMDGQIMVLLGLGGGAFGPPGTSTAGKNPVAIALGDLNTDGRADVVSANADYNNIAGGLSVLLGNGNGTFQGQTTILAGTSPRGVAISDLNRDGKADIAAANFGSGDISVLLGNGDGTFAAPINHPGQAGPSCVVVGDFNGDSKPDLAVANTVANNVTIFLNISK